VLVLDEQQRDAIIATCIRALPDEGCGLLLGVNEDDRAVARHVIASENVLHSAKVYEIDAKVLLRAYRRADDEGIDVLGVFHSHTHSEAYPSPTDVAQAPDPAWHYMLVSLRTLPTVLRSFSIVDGVVTEEEVLIR
jgi:proteasome lid subunit RPN8/RPN11